MVEELKETFRFRYVVYNFVYSSLKQRYRRSVLGFMWSVLAPLMQNLIIGVVFYYLMKFNMPNYIVYLFAGTLIYNIMSNVIIQSPTIMINNEGFIKKIYVPKLVFVLNLVSLEVVNFILILLSLLILGVAFGKLSFSLSYLFLPVSILVTIFFLIGTAIIISVLSVYFRDMIHIVPVVMQAMFFLTPVLYPISNLPLKIQKLIKLNPLYYFVDIFRTPVLDNHLPSFLHVMICITITVLMFFSGILLLEKYNNKIVFKL